MAKRFKLRISRVMTSFQTCNSKDPSTLPSDPFPSFLLQLSSPAKPHHHRSSFKRHVSSAFTSTGCGLCSNKNSHTRSQPEFKWQKEDKWHVVAIKAYNNDDDDDDNTPRQKIYNSSASGHSSDDLFPPPPPPPPTTVAAQKKLRIRKKKTTGGGVRLRISTSSAETGLFSSEADEPGSEEESETLVSTSRSLSTSDSSNPTSRRKPKTKQKKKSYRRRSEKSRGRESGVDGGGGGESPARLSVFKRLIPCGVLEGKVKESYAVVKKSEDPKEDFKRSMMEMVVEKQMFEERELEQLLECFLSLNSKQHHGVIVEAFSEIWEALFSTSTVKNKKKSSTASAGPPPVSSASLNKC